MTPARALGLGLLLTATAGYIDALGFVALGGYYTSFMSGNTTRLGAGLATGALDVAAETGGLLVLFFLGSFLGSLGTLARRHRGPAIALAIVLAGIACSLALNAAGYPPPLSMLTLAAAAGAQNAVLQPIGAARLGATFVTGTLFAAGQDLARATLKTAPPWRWVQHLMVWAALALGALVGALAYARLAMNSLYVPAAIYLAFLAWRVRRPVL